MLLKADLLSLGHNAEASTPRPVLSQTFDTEGQEQGKRRFNTRSIFFEIGHIFCGAWRFVCSIITCGLQHSHTLCSGGAYAKSLSEHDQLWSMGLDKITAQTLHRALHKSVAIDT